MLTIYYVRSSLDTASRGVATDGWPIERLLVTQADVRKLRKRRGRPWDIA